MEFFETLLQILKISPYEYAKRRGWFKGEDQVDTEKVQRLVRNRSKVLRYAVEAQEELAKHDDKYKDDGEFLRLLRRTSKKD